MKNKTRIMKLDIVTLITALVCCIIGLAANNSHAYQWTVRLPADIPIASCTVNLYAGAEYKQMTLNREQSVSWKAPNNAQLTDISGWDNNYIYVLKSRTCAGTDYDSGVDAVKCAYDVRVKLCQKGINSIGGKIFGFCPD